MDEHALDGNSNLQVILDELCEEVLDEISLGICFEVHRSCRLGTLFMGYSDSKIDKPRAIVDRLGVDVFGHVPTKKQVDCICPNCSRNMAAQRFAPHLEKCMGMGRNSSRIASRRIANNNTSNSVVGKRESEESDDGNDSDWSCHTDKRVKKLKKDKIGNSPRRLKTRIKNGESGEIVSTPESIAPYDTMSTEDRKSLLLATCGVISDHTHRMCTKSIKCPQHTHEQRRAVRVQLIGQTSVVECGEDIQVDIDGYDDADSHSLRETLQWEISSNSSPTDSIFTNSSNLKKRPLKSKSMPGHSKKPKPSITSGKTTASQPMPSSHYEFV